MATLTRSSVYRCSYFRAIMNTQLYSKVHNNLNLKFLHRNYKSFNIVQIIHRFENREIIVLDL